MKVKYNDKHWIVTKSLQDFEALGEELAAENPMCKAPEWVPVNDEDMEQSIVGRDDNIRIQRHLETYLRVTKSSNC